MEVQQQHSPAGVGPLDFSRRGVAEASAFRVVKPKQLLQQQSPQHQLQRNENNNNTNQNNNNINNNNNESLQESTRLAVDSEAGK